MQETWVQSLSQEDALEEGMTTHSSILAWRIPWTEETVRLRTPGVGDGQGGLACCGSWGHKELDTTEQLN